MGDDGAKKDNLWPALYRFVRSRARAPLHLASDQRAYPRRLPPSRHGIAARRRLVRGDYALADELLQRLDDGGAAATAFAAVRVRRRCPVRPRGCDGPRSERTLPTTRRIPRRIVRLQGLIKTMPRRASFAVGAEFLSSWTAWQQRCRYQGAQRLRLACTHRRPSRNDHSSEPAFLSPPGSARRWHRTAVHELPLASRGRTAVEPLQVALRLLAGEEAALTELSSTLQLSWQEILAATLIYINPTAKSHDIPYGLATRTQRCAHAAVHSPALMRSSSLAASVGPLRCATGRTSTTPSAANS